MSLSYFELGQDNNHTKRHILIIHGWASSKERFRSLGRELSRRGWHVVAVDLPGFGDTPAPGIPLTLAGYASAVREMTKQFFGGKNYIIFGHSFGGRVAARVAKSDKSIKGIILCAPGVGTMDPIARVFYKVISKGLLLSPKIRETVLKNFYNRSDGLTRVVLRGIRYEDPKKTFGGLKLPALILWGENDKVISVDSAELVKELVPRSLVKIFPGIGHSLPYFRGSRIAQEITTWSNTYNNHV